MAFFSALTTLTYFNTMLQPTNVVYPDSTSMSTTYTPDGNVRQTSGSRVYPVAYTYDGQGRTKTMTTWTGFSASTGAAVTTWNYDPNRGWLTSKLDNNSKGPTYTYTAGGRLLSRMWARPITNAYSYNPAGDLATVNYSDGTPGITNIYDRLGRLNTDICNGITTTLFYDSANDPLGESYSGGVLGGLATTNIYDGLLRRTNRSILNSSSSVLASAAYTYDAASRLSTVSDGINSAAYSYLANSPLVDYIVFAHSGASVMTNQNTYDYDNRLTGKSSALNFNYQYNTASQRTRVTLIDGSYWLYGYDALGQLTSANKYFWDGTPYAGQQFDYSFDTIGNRTGTQAGGDQTGANLRQAGYTNNLLNQIVSRGVPGYVDVMGLSLATNTVSVNGTNAYQKWEYFREQLGTNNSSAPQWVGISVTAPGQSTVSGSVYLAANPETFTYDLDGNLTNDGRWTYTWDGENRLVNMTSLTNTPIASQYSLSFAYDYMGRRIQKILSTNNGSGYVAQYTNLFVYDGWNLIGILNPQSALMASMMWGTDLSGNMQGAGGVGGLLAENIASNGVQFVAYDGNGNVVALVSATNGTVTANYEYGPFGELIRATGPMAKVNPFLFSTKFYDWESGLYYYGYRYYNPSTGRFINRDPIGERGGLNFYEFARDNPVTFFDRLGMETKTDEIWVKSDFNSLKITGPVGSKCCKVLTGDVKVDYAYIKATRDEKMGENHQEVINYITTAINTFGMADAKMQDASYLGAGFGITFKPSANAKTCCTNIHWEQRFIQDGQYYVPGIVTVFSDGIGGIDYKTSGATAVDFPGDTVGGFWDRDFGRSFLLTLFCDKQAMYSLTWGYHVKYDSTKQHATVTLDYPF